MVTNGHTHNNLTVSQGTLSHLGRTSLAKPNNSDIKSLQTALHVLSTQEEFPGKEFSAISKNDLIEGSSALLNQEELVLSAEISIDLNSFDFPDDLEVSAEITTQEKNEVPDSNIPEKLSSPQDKEVEISISFDALNFSELEGEMSPNGDNSTSSGKNIEKETISIFDKESKEKPINKNNVGKTTAQRLDSLEIKCELKIKELTVAVKLKMLEDVSNEHVETSIHNNVPVQVNRLSRTGIIILPSSMTDAEVAVETQRHQDMHRDIVFDVFVAPEHEFESFVQELQIRIDSVNEQKQNSKQKNNTQTTPGMSVRESVGYRTSAKKPKKPEKDNSDDLALLAQQEANKKRLETKQRLQDAEVAVIKKHEKLIEELQQIEKFVATLFQEVFKTMLRQETFNRDLKVKETPSLGNPVRLVR